MSSATGSWGEDDKVVDEPKSWWSAAIPIDSEL
jgi:hypothetical protein